MVTDYRAHLCCPKKISLTACALVILYRAVIEPKTRAVQRSMANAHLVKPPMTRAL